MVLHGFSLCVSDAPPDIADERERFVLVAIHDNALDLEAFPR